MPDEQHHVKIEPWIGQNFRSLENVFRQPTLILGGSHYSDDFEGFHTDQTREEWASFTNDVVEYYFDPHIEGRWKKTFSSFINSVFGHFANEDERHRFFDSVVFYNYLREIAGGTPSVAGKFDYGARGNFNAFWEVLEEHRPEVVISWGAKLWDALPNDWGYGPAVIGDPVMIDGKDAGSVYSYPFQDRTIRLVGVHHPSAGYGTTFHNELFRRLDLLR